MLLSYGTVYILCYDNVKKIKGAAHKDCDVDGRCKEALIRISVKCSNINIDHQSGCIFGYGWQREDNNKI